LLLNPDTLLLDPLAPVVDWLEIHPSYGALTIKMLDGDRIARACTGRFPSALRLALLRSMLVLPESYGAEEAMMWIGCRDRFFSYERTCGRR